MRSAVPNGPALQAVRPRQPVLRHVRRLSGSTHAQHRRQRMRRVRHINLLSVHPGARCDRPTQAHKPIPRRWRNSTNGRPARPALGEHRKGPIMTTRSNTCDRCGASADRDTLITAITPEQFGTLGRFARAAGFRYVCRGCERKLEHAHLCDGVHCHHVDDCECERCAKAAARERVFEREGRTERSRQRRQKRQG